MSKFIVRPAGREDIDALCSLYDEFHEYYVQVVPERLISLKDLKEDNQSGRSQRLKQIIEGEDSALFVLTAACYIVTIITA